ncbi:MAG TPA: acetyl-CoA decarbonylase/synthase complex subunit gamma [Candidatus Limnocylindrales bacterium]|nr:acetyl-CoA decarbonylase/synthase complex subunit gamma [Candidatus Limnocylindrales bacterium]
MPAKASDMQKLLPENGKKNCKECGLATCFAFAMKLANAGITLDKCPHLSAESRAQIEDMLLPPIRKVVIGRGARQVAIGEEEVMHRHQKTFFHPPGIAIQIADGEDEEVWSAKITKLGWRMERLDKISCIDLAALNFTSGNLGRYLQLVQKVLAETEVGLILMAEDADVLIAAYESAKDRNPLVCVTADNLAQVAPRLDKSAVVCVSASGLEALVDMVSKLKDAGLENLVLAPGSRTLADLIRDQTVIRRAALVNQYRPYGYPTLFSAAAATTDTDQQFLLATAAVVKYAGIIVLDDLTENAFNALLTVRQDIYTDPRVPPTVESKVYPFNEADQAAMVLVTTNFALTYYAVAGEVENSKQPTYLLCQDTGGLCVLAAWSTGKLVPETIAEMIKKQAVDDMVTRKRLVIPGLVARLKGDLEEELPGWEIIVGPREASDLPKFLGDLKKREGSAA